MMPKKGRPKGSCTRFRREVVVELPICWRCGSTSRTRLRKVKACALPPLPGSVFKGAVYDRVSYYRTECARCGAGLFEIRYSATGREWPPIPPAADRGDS
jgi:ribosomal protein S27AE